MAILERGPMRSTVVVVAVAAGVVVGNGDDDALGGEILQGTDACFSRPHDF